MATECVFPIQVLYDNTGVEEGAADEPESGGECTWLSPYALVCRWIRFGATTYRK